MANSGTKAPCQFCDSGTYPPSPHPDQGLFHEVQLPSAAVPFRTSDACLAPCRERSARNTNVPCGNSQIIPAISEYYNPEIMSEVLKMLKFARFLPLLSIYCSLFPRLYLSFFRNTLFLSFRYCRPCPGVSFFFRRRRPCPRETVFPS